jgi:signal transduction histidine kinase
VQLIRRAPYVSFAINDYAARLSRTQQEKDSMRDKLVQARKLEDWSRMSAVIAHEVSNPLEAVQNILYLLKTAPGASPETVELADQAAGEIGRVITISRSTLSFHRETVRPEMVDLCAVLESVRFLLKGIIREKNIDFEITAEGDFQVEAYPGETRQVVLNLARNACEATRKGSRVALTLAHAAGGVELAITDHGPGIPPADLPHLFEFGRSTNGLGLWTVKRIVEKHNGRIELDTNYREGARFVVFWPQNFSGSHQTATHPEMAPA